MRKTTRNVNITAAHKLHTRVSEYNAGLLFYYLLSIIIIIIIIIYDHYIFQKLNLQSILIAVAFITLRLSRIKGGAHF